MHLGYFLPFFVRSWCCALGLLIALLAGTASHGRTVLELDVNKQPVALADWGEYWLDSRGTSFDNRTADEVDTNGTIAWAPTLLPGIYPLKAGQVLWIRFTVPPAPDDERWVLEIPYPALDRASLYSKNKAGWWSEQRTGDLTAVNQWPTPHRHPLLAVKFNAEEPTRFLLRLENAQGFSAPLRFITSSQVLRGEQQTSLFLGFYFGMAMLGMLTGLICFAWLRERAYLYYSATCVLVGLTLAALSGAAALQLWPNSPVWADKSLSILGVWTLMSVVLLNACVVSLAQRSRLLNGVVTATVAIGLMVAVLLATTPSALRLTLFVPYLVLIPAVLIVINFWAWRHGDRFGGWLLLAAVPFAIGWAIANARYVGWLPLSVLTEQSGLATMALQLPIFLTALILRSQESLQNRNRMTGLDRIDPATGLLNEHVFNVRLLRMSIRSQRLGHHSAIVIIDLVNREQTQRDFGRKAADQLPVRMASRLLSTIRDIDSAARLSERRFGILVEGPISPQEAISLGPRIIARCLMPFEGLHVECVAQVRVAYALVPHQSLGGESLLTRLDERLTAAELANDKRSIFTLN